MNKFFLAGMFSCLILVTACYNTTQGQLNDMLVSLNLEGAVSLVLTQDGSSARSGDSFQPKLVKVKDDGGSETVDGYDRLQNSFDPAILNIEGVFGVPEGSNRIYLLRIENINSDYFILFYSRSEAEGGETFISGEVSSDYAYSYLVRKSDGAVFDLNTGCIPAAKTSIQYIPENNSVYLLGHSPDPYILNPVVQVFKLNLSNPKKITAESKTLADEVVSTFLVDSDENLLYGNFNLTQVRLSSEGLDIVPSSLMIWKSRQGQIYYCDHDSTIYSLNYYQNISKKRIVEGVGLGRFPISGDIGVVTLEDSFLMKKSSPEGGYQIAVFPQDFSSTVPIHFDLDLREYIFACERGGYIYLAGVNASDKRGLWRLDLEKQTIQLIVEDELIEFFQVDEKQTLYLSGQEEDGSGFQAKVISADSVDSVVVLNKQPGKVGTLYSWVNMGTQ